MNSEPSVQLVIPMAGKGQRFVDAGYELPKPLLDVHGIPMYQVVVANLFTSFTRSITVICPSSWGLSEEITSELNKICPKVQLIEIDYTTDGPAETVALALPALDPDLPLVVANSDQFVDTNLEKFDKQLVSEDVSGVILTMEDDDPKWSYARLDANGHVTEVVEKEVISHLATVGIYGFKTADTFSHALDQMRKSGSKVNNEWYVGPAYNFVEKTRGPIVANNLGPVSSTMFGMGIPIDYENFLSNEVSLRAARNAQELFDD